MKKEITEETNNDTGTIVDFVEGTKEKVSLWKEERAKRSDEKKRKVDNHEATRSFKIAFAAEGARQITSLVVGTIIPAGFLRIWYAIAGVEIENDKIRTI